MTKILVIEDETEIRANLLEFLSIEGYDIIGADNGVTGVIGALEHNPDLILCDVMMPELDGHGVLQALRQEPSTALIPFIFLTALADKGDIREGMNLGADDYLTKPFIFSEVTAAIETRLKGQAARSAQYQQAQDRVTTLQNDIQQMRTALDQEQVTLLSEIRSGIKASLIQLGRVDRFLKSLPMGTQREQSIAIVQQTCTANIEMLARIPNFEYLLEATPDSFADIEQSIEQLLTHA